MSSRLNHYLKEGGYSHVKPGGVGGTSMLNQVVIDGEVRITQS